MDSLSETPWDVVICGTGLRQSLLALALSRSDKKVLHIDSNQYYGGAEAAFSLQEVDEWVEKLISSNDQHFQNASTWKLDADDSVESDKLSFSRAYTLTLSSQIIYTRSKLLAHLVSSKVYRQLEFQAVGNWWLYEAPHNVQPSEPILRRLPNGREDIFQDHGIDNRAKRSLMKFLKFVIDYDNQVEVWESYSQKSMPEFLSSQFQIPPYLQATIIALTLSLENPEKTLAGISIPRIARHLTSMGVFGPGFGAVFPKWGGGAEIAQVACRAGAVGGGVYILGSGIQDSKIAIDGSEDAITRTLITLSNGENIKTKHLSSSVNVTTEASEAVSKIIAVVSSPLTSLFVNSIEGSPTAAVSIVVFPPGTLCLDETAQSHPIYIMVHSNETGECPVGQCVLYATVKYSSSSKNLLEAAINSFIQVAEGGEGKVLFRLYYEQQAPEHVLDLAFNDDLLDQVKQEWEQIMGDEVDGTSFMQFEERAGISDDENAAEGY